MNAGFKLLTDWFDMASAALKLVSSNDGKGRQLVQVSHTGSIDVVETGSLHLNPTCTYDIVADTTITGTLGKAYKAGYMIVSIAVETRRGKFPQLTITAVENEGKDAINKWDISIPVKARARAQNLLDGTNNADQLQVCKVTAKCDPVVVYQGLEPIASDVVHGKYVLNATVASGSGTASVAAASGFVETRRPLVGGDTDYSTMSINAERKLT